MKIGCKLSRLVEHLTVNQGVVGSSPTVGANEKASISLAFLLFVRKVTYSYLSIYSSKLCQRQHIHIYLYIRQNYDKGSIFTFIYIFVKNTLKITIFYANTYSHMKNFCRAIVNRQNGRKIAKIGEK